MRRLSVSGVPSAGLRRCIAYDASCGTGRRPRRATCPASCSRSLGKDRFDLMESLRRDRERVERSRGMPWRARLKELQAFPWKFFIAFMAAWSWLGTYAVPYLKSMRPGEIPPLADGSPMPEEIAQKAMPTPSFKHLSKQ